MAMLAERECRSPRGANRAGGARGDAGVGVGKSRYPEGGGGGRLPGSCPRSSSPPSLDGAGGRRFLSGPGRRVCGGGALGAPKLWGWGCAGGWRLLCVSQAGLGGSGCV